MSKSVSSQLFRFLCICALGVTGIAGCGGDAAPSSCALSAQLSGAVEWQGGSGNPACVIPFGTNTVSLTFAAIEGDVEFFTLYIQGLKEGQTGSYPASVEIKLRDKRSWKTAATGCTVHIDEQVFDKQDEFRKQYLSAGSGECSTPAMAQSGATGTINIAPFTFRSPTNY